MPGRFGSVAKVYIVQDEQLQEGKSLEGKGSKLKRKKRNYCKDFRDSKEIHGTRKRERSH